MSADTDQLRADLATLVEAFNAEHDPAERVALHREIIVLRHRLAEAEREHREEASE